MKWQLIATGVLPLCVLSIVGCANTAAQNKTQKKPVGPPMKLKTVNAFVAEAGNEFGFDVFRRAMKQSNRSNLLIAPLSLSSSLLMTYNGAANQTQKEMALTMRLGGLTLQTINAANAALQWNLGMAIPNNDPQIEIAIANSLWAKKGIAFETDFLARNAQFYNAKISSLDLSTPGAMNAMNAWAKQNTKGKIEKMFDAPPPPDARLILMNAVYFNGKWQDKFEKSETKDAPFYLQDGRKKSVPMMSREGNYSYRKARDFEAVELLYGEGDLSLILVLPDKKVALDALLSKIADRRWEAWRAEMSSQKGQLSLPRFKMEFEIELQDTLRKMGMKSAFSNGADFREMRAQNDLFISQVKQKTFIEVNEEGTEAAAVTSARVAGSAPSAPFQFIADRPFFGAIVDNNSGAILFLMIVREP